MPQDPALLLFECRVSGIGNANGSGIALQMWILNTKGPGIGTAKGSGIGSA